MSKWLVSRQAPGISNGEGSAWRHWENKSRPRQAIANQYSAPERDPDGASAHEQHRDHGHIQEHAPDEEQRHGIESKFRRNQAPDDVQYHRTHSQSDEALDGWDHAGEQRILETAVTSKICLHSGFDTAPFIEPSRR